MPRHKKGYRGEGRVQVLALLPEIKKAFDEGRSLFSFYEENKDRTDLSYSQLCRYVRAFDVRPKLGTGAGTKEVAESKPSVATETQAKQAPIFTKPTDKDQERTPKQYQPEEPKKSFEFNPLDAITKKLI